MCNVFYRVDGDRAILKTTLREDWKQSGSLEWTIALDGRDLRVKPETAQMLGISLEQYRGVFELAIPLNGAKGVLESVVISTGEDRIEWSRDTHRSLDGLTGNCAFVHHGNQGLTYTDVFRGSGSSNGFDEVLSIHDTRNLPGNFHLSGTLITAADWYDKPFLQWMRDGIAEGWLAVLTSAYAQHIMPFVNDNMNNWAVHIEQELISDKLGYEAHVAWIPERVWCAQGISPDAGLSDPWLGDNWTQHGVNAVILDDWPHVSGHESRQIHWMNNGAGITLRVIPITGSFTGNCHYDPGAAISQIQGTGQYRIVVYGTDWEAAAEMADFSCPNCLENYSQVANWVADNMPAVESWKLDAALNNPDFNGTGINVGNGTYGLIGGDQGYGGTNNSWYTDWAGTASHSDYHTPSPWNYGQIWTTVYNQIVAAPSNNLSETAWYVMMTNLHETAWHDYMGGPISGWEHRYSSHIKNAAVYAEAARWAAGLYATTCAAFYSDIDIDGINELVIHNDRVFAVFESIGGRAQYIFSKGPGSENFSIVGSCNTYWAETDGDYDESGSNNHQAAFAEVSPHYRNDLFALSIDSSSTSYAKIRLSFGGVTKTIEVTPGNPYLDVRYSVGAQDCYIKHGITPDLLSLIWDADMERVYDPSVAYTGFRNPNGGATGALILGNGGATHNLEFSGTLLRGDEIKGSNDFGYLFYAGPTSPADPQGNITELEALAALNLDHFAPKLDAQAVFINANTIEVSFNESVHQTLAQTPANWSLSGFTQSHTVTAAVRQSDWRRVRLTVTPNLAGGQTGLVSVINVQDLNGNAVNPNYDTATLNTPSGLTPHTIVIDGIKDFDVANECLFVGTDTLTITWDTSALYFGYWNKDLATGDFFIDIDTNQTVGSGAATDSWGRVNLANPYRIEYQIAIEGGPNNIQINRWNGASWVFLNHGSHGATSYNGWSGNPFTEVRIPWSDLNNPTKMALAVHLTQENTTTTTRAFPTTNPTGVMVTLSQFYLLFPPHTSGPLPIFGARTKNILSAPLQVADSLVIQPVAGVPRLTWPIVPQAHTYEIWRATTPDGVYSKIDDTAATTYDDLAPPADKAFYYVIARGGL
ncbi:hypothetical protein IT157_09645 [bacterium]|nr:hypothetical protein [bacterium]